MSITFYYHPASAPCRAVLLAAKAIGVELNLKHLDLMKGENMTPEFLKINPQHVVPTITDNEFSLCESRAIMTYLQNQYGRNDSLYSKVPKKRALVDQRLYFDMGTLYPAWHDCYTLAALAEGKIDPEKIEKVNKALQLLETFLDNSQYAAGDELTLADLSLAASISQLEVIGHDLSPYKNIIKWYELIKQTAPGYEEANGKYLKDVKEIIDTFTKK